MGPGGGRHRHRGHHGLRPGPARRYRLRRPARARQAALAARRVRRDRVREGGLRAVLARQRRGRRVERGAGRQAGAGQRVALRRGLDHEGAPGRRGRDREAPHRRPVPRLHRAGGGMTSPHPYIPNTGEDRRAMLGVIGVASAGELFADIPPELRIDGLELPPALPEQDLLREMGALAASNQVPEDGYACFLGGGAYRHFIPSVVSHVIGRAEFYTAYTPYQPEISQGTLQTMFELQSMACELTGMDVA